MSSGEEKLADSPGKFVQLVVDGRKRTDVAWRSGRLLLSTKRLVLVSNEGKRTIPLSAVSGVTDRTDVNQAITRVSGYLSVQAGKDVTLLAPQAIETFEQELYGALLDQTAVLVKHPAVEGGVVQNSTWEKGRLTVDEDTVNLATSTGTFVELLVDDVGTVERTETVLDGTRRRTVEVEHTIDGTSVETHVSGDSPTVAVLETFVRRGEEDNESETPLSEAENEVLMALYTGVSPFQIPSFVGMDITDVEDIFERLVEAGILETVRTRREVQLEARGRSIASEAMEER